MVFVSGEEAMQEEVQQEYCLLIPGRTMRYKCRGLVNQEFKIYDESNLCVFTKSYNGCITLLAFVITFFDQKKAAVPVQLHRSLKNV